MIRFLQWLIPIGILLVSLKLNNRMDVHSLLIVGAAFSLGVEAGRLLFIAMVARKIKRLVRGSYMVIRRK